jgi:hypothetical protein
VAVNFFIEILHLLKFQTAFCSSDFHQNQHTTSIVLVEHRGDNCKKDKSGPLGTYSGFLPQLVPQVMAYVCVREDKEKGAVMWLA